MVRKIHGKKMKELSILIYSMGSGGAERQVSILLKELSKKYEIQLVLMNDAIFYEIPKNICVKYLEKSKPNENGVIKLLKLPLLGWRYKNIAKNSDISLSFMTRPNYINIFAKLFGSKIKTIVSERSYFSIQYGYKNLQSIANRYLVKLYNYADVVVTNSKENAKDLSENFSIKSPIDMIYNAIDISYVLKQKREYVDIEKKHFTFVTIGRIDRGKNHNLLLEAVAKLDASLWIIGEGCLMDNLKFKIENLGLKDRVRLLGRQKNPYKFLSKADCFVFASSHEGFPNVLLEALACGLPVISTDCKSGPREILAPSTDYIELRDIEMAEYGILTPVGDAKTMTKAMEIMIKDAKLRDIYRRISSKRVENFEIHKVIDKWNLMLKSI